MWLYESYMMHAILYVGICIKSIYFSKGDVNKFYGYDRIDFPIMATKRYSNFSLVAFPYIVHHYHFILWILSERNL